MMSASSGNGLSLASIGEVFSELVIGENAIVRMVFLMIAEAILFVAMFSLKGFNCIGSFLEVGKDVTSGNINKEGASTIMSLRAVTAHCVGESGTSHNHLIYTTYLSWL